MILIVTMDASMLVCICTKKNIVKDDVDLWCSVTINHRLPDAGEQIQHGLVFFLAARFAKDVPETQSFVARAGHDRFAIRRHRQIEHSVGMTGELGHLREAWILPHENLVLRVTVRAD